MKMKPSTNQRTKPAHANRGKRGKNVLHTLSAGKHVQAKSRLVLVLRDWLKKKMLALMGSTSFLN